MNIREEGKNNSITSGCIIAINVRRDGWRHRRFLRFCRSDFRGSRELRQYLSLKGFI
ncbi:hypothetical protein [Aminicella lysinilytica]|uniref:hypothetical protein n=1 Tax=Aminicella lysinilytica TaxID=433323 RepID=UPI00141503A1|nr:hypothetical protein [Aminicella lysinilytica]